jgi:O-antigen ligase
VLLTASRGGALAASVALVGTAVVLTRGNAKQMVLTFLAAPVAVLAMAAVLPKETIQRILTIPEQLAGGGELNQRLSIWAAGAQALARAPFIGSGAGTFVSAAGLRPADTAHNTPLAIVVESGVAGLAIACAILAGTVRFAWRTSGSLRRALPGSLAVWAVTSLVATVHENRTTWVLIALIAIAARMSAECPAELDAVFEPSKLRGAELALQDAR